MRAWKFLYSGIALATQLGRGWASEEVISHVAETTSKSSANLFTDQGASEDREHECNLSELPACRETSGTSDARTIGYYQASSYTRIGRQWSPESINTRLLTHINYAFAVVGEDHRIAARNTFDPELYVRMTELKTHMPALKVFISVDVSAAGGRLWSDMIGTAEGRATFVELAMRFMGTFAFDGVDFFWTQLDGELVKGESYVQDSITLMEDLRKATYGVKQISLAVPALMSSLDLLNLPRMARRVDWINLMNPLWHSQMRNNEEEKKERVMPHSNLTEIDGLLNQFMQAGIGPRQLVMGTDFYGRSFKIGDSSCSDVTGSSTAGIDSEQCLHTFEILSQAEIMDLLEQTKVAPELNREAAVKQFSWKDQWISYDDDQTIDIKKRFANSRCISGTAAWSVDLDAQPDSSLYSIAAKHSLLLHHEDWPARQFIDRDVAGHTRIQNDAGTMILLSECAPFPECPAGFHSIGSAHGAWSQFDTLASGCNNTPRRATGFDTRAMCIPDNIETHGCTWVGDPPFCGAGCPRGSVQMALNNGPSRTSPAQFCSPYTWSTFCCEEVHLTDQPQSCDDHDLGSMIVHGSGPSAIGADGIAVRQNLRMAQAWGPNEGLLASGLRVFEASEICKNVR